MYLWIFVEITCVFDLICVDDILNDHDHRPNRQRPSLPEAIEEYRSHGLTDRRAKDRVKVRAHTEREGNVYTYMIASGREVVD
jgi:hypothetical protein